MGRAFGQNRTKLHESDMCGKLSCGINSKGGQSGENFRIKRSYIEKSYKKRQTKTFSTTKLPVRNFEVVQVVKIC